MKSFSLIADIDGDFKMQLEDLAPLLLAPDKLVVKTINGNSVTGKDLLEYFKVLCSTYRSWQDFNQDFVYVLLGVFKFSAIVIYDTQLL